MINNNNNSTLNYIKYALKVLFMKEITKFVAVLLVVFAVLVVAEHASKTTTANNITLTEKGGSITLKNEETFNIKLHETMPSYWQFNLSKGLIIVSEKYTPYPQRPGALGGGGAKLWVIKAVDKGSQQVEVTNTNTQEKFIVYVEVI
jgi:predicted secreted protein